MGNNFCHQCGSRKFRADRSLAGRLVCISCGLPIGKNNVTSRFNKRSKSNRNLYWIPISVITFLIVIYLTR